MQQHLQASWSSSRMFDSCGRSVLGDMLVLDGRRVIWSSEGGNKHIRQFSCPTEPLDAIFCSFPSISDDREKMDVAVAILLARDHLCLHQTNGESFDISLDFDVDVDGMFATSDGLLLQSAGGVDREGNKFFGNLYALPHPVTLLRPVTLMATSASPFIEGESMSVDNRDDGDDDDEDDDNVEYEGGAQDKNESMGNLSLRTTSFSSPGGHSSAYRSGFDSNYESTNRVVAVLDNIVITCQKSESEGGDSTINMWILQPLLMSPDDVVDRAMDGHVAFRGSDSNGLPPLAPASTQGSASRSFRSISDGRGGRHGGSPPGWSSSKPDRGDSPSFSSLTGPSGPTEVLENALGVSTGVAAHPSRHHDYDSLAGPPARTRSPVQHLLGGTGSGHHTSGGGGTDLFMNDHIHGSGGAGAGTGATPAGHSMLSGLSANTADEESFAVINALSNAELSLVLTDSAVLAIDAGMTWDELRVHFTGHPHAAGGLVLHVLHPPTGFHACYSVSVRGSSSADGGQRQGQRRMGGSIVALPPVQFSQPPLSLATCSVPLFPWTSADRAPGLAVPITLVLLASKGLEEGARAALMIGGTCIGEEPLRWDDDLDIDALLSPEGGGGGGGASSAGPGSSGDAVTGLLTCGSPRNGFVVERASGAYAVVSLEPALFEATGEQGRAPAELVLSLLAVLQGVTEATDPATQPERRRQYSSLAEVMLGLLVQSAVMLGPGAGVPLLVHALFGTPLDNVPEIASVVSAGGARSLESEARIASLYSTIVRAVEALSGGDGSGSNLRATLFDSLHAAVEDASLSSPPRIRGEGRSGGLRGVLVALASCTARAGDAAGALYSQYYVSLLGSPTDTGAGAAAGAQQGGTSFTKFTSAVPSAARWVALCLEEIERASVDPPSGAARTPGAAGLRAALPSFFLPPRLKGSPGLGPCPSLRSTKKFLKALLLRVHVVGVPSSPSSSSAGKAAGKARVVADSFVKSHREDSLTNLALLPPLLRVVVQSAFHACREAPNAQWPDCVLGWMGREDLCHYHHRRQDPAALAAGTGTGMDRAPPSTQQAGSAATALRGKEASSDGLDEVETAASLRFAEDDRMREACRLLRSSASIYLRLEKAPETSDLDHRHQLQLRLLSLCRRSLACSVGRGMLTLGSLEPLIAEALPVPALNLTGRVPPNNTIVHLDTASAPAELTLWPDFHNGAAAGLRVGLGAGKDGKHSGGAGAGGGGAESGVKVTRYWIIYNRTAAAAAAATALAAKNSNTAAAGSNNVSTESAISSHAGVLLALGLQGHLSVLGKGDICDYLTQGHEPTTIAMLIGIAASKLGSADPHMSKTLCLYLPTLLPPRHWDISISPLVQTAALAGLGLLHAGSGHRLITEFLLAELSRRPPSDRCDNRETMALAASWALGLVLLGRGRGASSSSGGGGGGGSSDGMEGLLDLRIDDRLCQLFTGGKKPEESHLFPSAVSPAADGGSRASRTLEGDEINTDLTGPGALIALALIYIRSNNVEIARRMAVPDTTHALDSIRPDMLLYRALAVCLVMWDGVEPSEKWIDAQVPAVINKVLFPAKHAASSGSAEEKSAGVTSSDKSRQLGSRDALYLYMCIVTGYCFGMGLVYAGTSDDRAKNAILSKLRFLQQIRDNRLSLGLSPPLILDRSVKSLVDMCVGVVAISLSVVMAGTGDVESLRIVRELRWRVEDVNFGTHLALSMSIGMLFLAGGNASVKRDPLSIACLLLSICPRFPSRTVDNQYHMQAFRHLYVVAVQSRVLKSVDVDTGEPVPVTVDMRLKDGSSMPIRAPCLLPELDSIASLRINGGSGSGHNDSRKTGTGEGEGEGEGKGKDSKRGESAAMEVAGADANNLSAPSTASTGKRRQLDIFCSGGVGGSPQFSAAQDLYPLELRLGESSSPLEAEEGGLDLLTSSVRVTPSEVQSLKVKRRKDGSARATMGSASPSGEPASSRLERVLSDFVRAKVPSQTPSLPERAQIDGEILQETYLQMLKTGSEGASALSGAVERTTLFDFL